MCSLDLYVTCGTGLKVFLLSGVLHRSVCFPEWGRDLKIVFGSRSPFSRVSSRASWIFR